MELKGIYWRGFQIVANAKFVKLHNFLKHLWHVLKCIFIVNTAVFFMISTGLMCIGESMNSLKHIILQVSHYLNMDVLTLYL